MTGGGAHAAGSTGGTSPATATEADSSDKSIGTLVKEIATDLSTLVRKEIELAKVELKQEASKGGKAAGLLGGAGLAGWMTALFVSLAIVWLLDAVMDAGWAALIVAVVWAIIGAVLFSAGRKKLSQVDPKPERTVRTVKEDVEWAKTRSGSNATSS